MSGRTFILDDSDKIRLIGVFGPDFCVHGLGLDISCPDCEEESEDLDPEDASED